MIDRSPDSHKGDNGKIAIIGGSRFQHGAPLFSALAAEASGADLVFVLLPAVHAEAAKQASLNFQVYPFAGTEIAEADLPMILKLLATMDCAVIGPGLGRDKSQLSVIKKIIEASPCPLVIDASALQPFTLKAAAGKNHIVTPHLGELERMGIDASDLGKTAQEHGVTILQKGRIDHIAGPDGIVHEVVGGNAGLTVGGTGDALAGLAGGLVAQGMKPAEACIAASTAIKRAGDVLFAEKGFGYTTKDVIGVIPSIGKNLQ